MSSTSPKPDSSVAGSASARRPGSRTRAGRAARPGSGRRSPRCPGRSRRRAGSSPARSRARSASGRVSGPSATPSRPVALDDLAPQRLAERRRRLRDLLEQEVRELAAVDVAGRDLGALQLVGRRPAAACRRSARRRDRRRASPACAASSTTTWPRVAAARSGRPASRRPCGGRCESPRPGRRARSRRRRRPRRARRRAPGRCRAATRRSVGGPGRARAAMRDRTRRARDGGAERLVDGRSPSSRRRATSVGITFASVVISGGICSLLERP